MSSVHSAMENIKLGLCYLITIHSRKLTEFQIFYKLVSRILFLLQVVNKNSGPLIFSQRNCILNKIIVIHLHTEDISCDELHLATTISYRCMLATFLAVFLHFVVFTRKNFHYLT